MMKVTRKIKAVGAPRIGDKEIKEKSFKKRLRAFLKKLMKDYL